MTPFRIAIVAFCGFIAVLALMIFSGVIPSPFKQQPVGLEGGVVLWGTLPRANVEKYIGLINEANKATFSITYEAKDPNTIEAELVDALASGRGPDIVLLPHESLLHQEGKFALMPYESIPEDYFNDTFIPGTYLFKRSTGLLAMPLYVDPLVMYYNDDLLTKSNVVKPPKFWTEVGSSLSNGMLKKVTQIDERNNIHQSLIAFGGFDNVTHAKDILSLLIMQVGDPVVSGVLGNLNPGMGQASVIALNFFIQFSDPTKEQYTWNSALPKSGDAFSVGKLALYVGAVSDWEKFKKINPHFTPRVALVPQRDQNSNQTFGRFYGIAITNASVRKGAALEAVKVLTNQANTRFFSEQVGLPPARRDLIGLGSKDPQQAVFYRAALSAKAWFDVDPENSTRIFRTMVQNILSGFEDSGAAVGRAARELVNK